MINRGCASVNRLCFSFGKKSRMSNIWTGPDFRC